METKIILQPHCWNILEPFATQYPVGNSHRPCSAQQKQERTHQFNQNILKIYMWILDHTNEISHCTNNANDKICSTILHKNIREIRDIREIWVKLYGLLKKAGPTWTNCIATSFQKDSPSHHDLFTCLLFNVCAITRAVFFSYTFSLHAQVRDYYTILPNIR